MQPYDASSVSSKQQRHSVLSVTEQKVLPEVVAFISKSAVVNVGSTAVVELAPEAEAVVELTPEAELNLTCIETNDVTNANILSSLLSGKKQRAPSLPAKGVGIPEREKNTVCYLAVCFYISILY